ncbi:MAG TPA: glycosyltransferase family 4 protein [Gemmatimonadaceae bacterium]
MQAALMRREFEEFGLTAPPVYEPMIERECEEYEAADAIQVISTFARRSFIERGVPESKLILTPLAVDLDEVGGAPRPARVHGPLRVLFLGTISLQKGVHYLLQATGGFAASDLTLSLYGGATADGRELLRRYARGDEWKGKVARAGLREVLADHDVLVLASVQDGFGAVICEAMAAGLPVIASENTGGPDVIRDGIDGFVVPARSASAIRSRLELLVEDRARCAEMGRAALEAMGHHRTWDYFVDDMLKQYDARLKSHAARG